MKLIIEPLPDKDQVVVHLPRSTTLDGPHIPLPHTVDRTYLTPGDSYSAVMNAGTRRYDIRIKVMPPNTPPEPTLVAAMRAWLMNELGIELTDTQAIALARVSNGLDAVPAEAN
jgi:hypothetical protein